MSKSLIEMILSLGFASLLFSACTQAPTQTVFVTPKPTSMDLEEVPKTGSTPVISEIATPSPLPTATVTPVPTLKPTTDIWQIQRCQSGSNILGFDHEWLWEYTGEIEGRGNVDMLLNFTDKNEILGFAFDSGKIHEYRVNGCVHERNFTMWLSMEGIVDAIIQGEFPAVDPRGNYKDSELKGDVITGSLVDKSQQQASPVYLRLSSGTSGTLQHRFQLAGLTDDAKILDATQRFLIAIANNDRQKVAEMIAFPVKVRIHLGEMYEIQTPELLLAQYDAIFDNNFKARLGVTFPNYLMAYAGNFIGQIGLTVYGGGGIVFNEYGQVISIANWETSELPPTPSPLDTRVPTPTLAADCGIAKLGIPGSQQLTDNNTPGIWLQGTVRLCTNFSSPALEAIFDLDSGESGTQQADIQYDTDTILPYVLFGINGALSQYWTRYGFGANAPEPLMPTYDQCKQQYIDPERWDVESIYLCVITNEDRVSRIKIENFNAYRSVAWVEISFITWNK